MKNFRQKLKDYFCSHGITETKTWLEKNSIHTETTCVECKKGVPPLFTAALGHSYKISLLEKSRDLKEGEKIFL